MSLPRPLMGMDPILTVYRHRRDYEDVLARDEYYDLYSRDFEAYVFAISSRYTC